MNEQITGLILKQTDYRENAVILTVLTDDCGKLSLVAAGVRKMNSKNAGSVLPYTKADFSLDYRPDRTMFRMKTARTVSLYRFLHEDLLAGCAASLMAECADAMTLEGPDEESAAETYRLLDLSFQHLNEKKPADLTAALFLSSMLRTHGIGPEVDECVLCGKPEASAFSVKEGGFLCAEDAAARNLKPWTIEQLRAFRVLAKAGPEQIELVSPYFHDWSSLTGILVSFLELHAGIHLRSFGLFQRFFGIEADM
ncbi:MAG: DNA repair protein RecO [Bulleidia sp.]